MSGYPYNGNPQQYPSPYGQNQPNLNINMFSPPPPQPGYPYQPGQPPAAMSYPNVTPTAPAGPGFNYGMGIYPNITPTPVYEPVIEWVPTSVLGAHALANRAVVAGYEGYDSSPLWVIRARFEGDLIPGKLAVKHNAAFVPWGGKENSVKDIEVCCARPEKVRWVESRDGVIPANAVPGGHTSSGEPLYIGRAKQQGSLTPGKVHPSHRAMYISFAGQEVAHKVYEILCTI